MKLSSITDPFYGESKTLPFYEVAAIGEFVKLYFPLKKFNVRVIEFLNLTTAGPNWPISSLSAPFDSVAIVSDKALFQSFARYCSITNNEDLLNNLYEEYRQSILSKTRGSRPKHFSGKLSKKFEAAGKVRIFAICD